MKIVLTQFVTKEENISASSLRSWLVPFPQPDLTWPDRTVPDSSPRTRDERKVTKSTVFCLLHPSIHHLNISLVSKEKTRLAHPKLNPRSNLRQPFTRTLEHQNSHAPAQPFLHHTGWIYRFATRDTRCRIFSIWGAQAWNSNHALPVLSSPLVSCWRQQKPSKIYLTQEPVRLRTLARYLHIISNAERNGTQHNTTQPQTYSPPLCFLRDLRYHKTRPLSIRFVC